MATFSLMPYLSRNGVDQIKTAGKFRSSFVVTLHGVVEGSLGIQKLDKAGFPAPVRVFGRLSHLASLLQHVSFDTIEQVLRGHILNIGILDLILDADPQRLDFDCDLLLLLTGSFDFPLITIEHRQGQAEENTERIPRAQDTISIL